MQFTIGTWNEAGGDETSVFQIAKVAIREQLYRAWIIWKKRQWNDWGTKGFC
jgi:hypothetical protein